MRAATLILGFVAGLGLIASFQDPPPPPMPVVPEGIKIGKIGLLTDVPPVDLDQPLDGGSTVNRLASRLRLMTGDSESLLKKLQENAKGMKGKELNEKDLFKGMNGNEQNFLKSLLDKLKADPSAFDSLKGMAGSGQSLEGLKGMIDGLKVDGATIPDLKGGLPNLNGKGPGGITLPENAPQWMRDALAGWEKNVGPIKNNPELQKMLDGFLSKENGFDPSKWKEWMNGQGFDTSKLDGLFGKNGPQLDLSKVPDPKLNLQLNLGNSKLPSWNFGSPSVSPPSAPSMGGGWSFGGFGGIGGSGFASLTPILIILAIAVVGVLVWMYWPQIKESLARRGSEPALVLPAGFDPRLVTDRATLIQAFELLSVVLCGPTAKTWNHITIGGALKEFLATNPAGGEQLAVLYALARYTPENEPLTPEAIAQARSALCTLAGVSA